MPAINTASHNALGILYRYLADGFGHKDHGSRHDHHDCHGYQRHQYAADTCLNLKHTHKSLGIAGDDSSKDDQGYSVADAMFGDLLTQPHHDHGTRDQGHDAGEVEKEIGANHHRTGGAGHGGESHRDGHSVEGSQQHSAIAGNLVNLLLPVRAFFAQLFKIGNYAAQKLDHDRGRDIGHNSQGKDRRPFKVSTHKQVEQPEEGVVGLGLEK